MPSQYIILRPAGDVCRNTEVVFYDSDKQTRNVLFTGKRWHARRFLRDYRKQIAWENVPAFCEKIAYGNNPPSCIEIPFGQL